MDKQLEIAMNIADKQISALVILFEMGMNGHIGYNGHENGLIN